MRDIPPRDPIRRTPKPPADERPQMAIADLYAAGAPEAVKGPPCGACHLLATLEPSEATALRQLLSDPLWRYSALSDALAAEGHKIADFTLARHARGQCAAGEKLRGR